MIVGGTPHPVVREVRRRWTWDLARRGEEVATVIAGCPPLEIIMDLGLGLPISNPGRLLDWARRAETAGFDTLALLDRLAFDNPEPLVALSVLAGATARIRLQTEVLLGPLRATALLAKQVATLDRMSGGRFVLGIGAGGRDDDHAAAGTPITRRGRLLDAQLTALRGIWRGEPYSGALVGPRPATPGGPPILVGAFASAALRRGAPPGGGFPLAAPPPRGRPPVARVHWPPSHTDRLRGFLLDLSGDGEYTSRVIRQSDGRLSPWRLWCSLCRGSRPLKCVRVNGAVERMVRRCRGEMGFAQ